jgi:hypothetical protein
MCKICGKRFYSYSTLRDHLRFKHKVVVEGDEALSGFYEVVVA